MLERLRTMLPFWSSEPPSLDRQLTRMDAHLENLDALVEPAPDAEPRTPFDSDLPREEITMANLSLREILRLLPDFLPLNLGMRRSARMYDGRFRPTRSEASPEFIAELEALAREAGAWDIAYVEVPRHAIFRDKGVPHRYAVVFTVEMEREAMRTAPSFEAMHEVIHGYKELAVISNRLARMMRRNGFAAYPGTAVGGLTDYPHLAERAGLGAIGYHGLLISPGEGARLRINTIYTNITNLPVRDPSDNEHLWVRDFCAMCRKCIRSCPVDAIFDEPQPRANGSAQCIDHDRCRDYFMANHGCAVCLAVCPFSEAGYDKIRRGFAKSRAAGSPPPV